MINKGIIFDSLESDLVEELILQLVAHTQKIVNKSKCA